MADPSLELQRSIVLALKSSPAIQAVVGNNVFDRVPDSDPFPRVTVGEGQLLDDGNSCADAWEFFADIHAWSRSVGMPVVKRLAAAVRDALATELDVIGFRVVEGRHRDTRFINDSDALTTHAVVTVSYLIDPEA